MNDKFTILWLFLKSSRRNNDNFKWKQIMENLWWLRDGEIELIIEHVEMSLEVEKYFKR